ncbi:MAG TPA: fibronectin type III domain-containing protein [Thermoanaerobaculia bacterium]|nr:fibronectin type III domain-containing protein [Thermoanaerobaculia bacterium]
MGYRLALILAVLFLLAPVAWATTHEVTVVSFQFIPDEVTINVGDTVHWTIESGGHNVNANDGSFRSGAPGAVSSFSHTFNSVGTFGYHCEPHGIAGMVGLVKVTPGGGGGEQRGTLKLANTAANVVEGNQVTLQVLRIGGDDGPVSVSYSVEAGTAQGADFDPENGTLSWADNDDDPKAITVQTNEDAAAEGNETVKVFLANPTGGATLDAAKTATVTIQDDDAAGTVPTAPTNLQAHAHSTTEVMLTWNDSNGETGYRIERKTLGGTFQQVATAAANSSSAIVGGLTPATFYTFRIRAENASGFSGYSNEVGLATNATPVPCVESGTTLCLNNGRFQVDVEWRAPGAQAAPATAISLEFAPESGLFYFSSPSNIEMLVKLLNACNPALGNKYWVFYAATTNVEFTMTVTDTQTGFVKVYHNPENTPAPPVQDTSAFATCP